MGETMRACVLADVRRMEIGDVPRADVGPRDVLVRPAAVGMCGTDFHIWAGHSNFHFDEHGDPIPLTVEPQVLGHEVTGEVVEVGREVHDLAAGDRVLLDQGLNCKSVGRSSLCEYCASGDTHQCVYFQEYGITGLAGGFADALVLPALNAIRIESDLAFDLAVMSEPLGCVMHSSDFGRRANARYSIGAAEPVNRVRTVLICGAGPAGLLFVQVLRHVHGFDGRILIIDHNDKKRALAEKLGAEALDPRGDVAGEVRERTGGRMCELLVEATGSGSIYELVPNVIRKQATILMYGVGHGDAPLTLLNGLQWKEPTVVMSVGASGGFDDDGRPEIYRRSLHMIEQGKVDVRSIVTHRYGGLDAVPEAFVSDPYGPDYVKGVALLS